VGEGLGVEEGGMGGVRESVGEGWGWGGRGTMVGWGRAGYGLVDG